MSEETELVSAASTGAAAAVAAVQDDQAEAERAASMEVATETATMAAEDAAQRAEAAAEAAVTATEAANQATEQATVAGATAADAADQAYSVQSDLANLREEMRGGWQSFRQDMTSFLDERLGAKKDQQPTEVVVNERTNTAADQRANPGGNGSVGDRGPESERPRRHRFGRH